MSPDPPTPQYVLVHDVGTTNNKACIYKLGQKLELVDSQLVEYPLYILEKGGAEQKVAELWGAIVDSTKLVLATSQVDPQDIQGIAFCAQMQAFIPVDQEGNALRNPMNYLDSRSTAQIEKYLYNGLIKIQEWNAFTLLRWIQINGGAGVTPKDPIWKYHWVKDNEPEVFNGMHKWLDVKDYLVLRASGEFTMGIDSAHVTFLYDTRPGKLGWSEPLCRKFDIDMDHLPRVIEATDLAGKLTPQAAAELGLTEGTPVIGGGGDLALISLGSGCFETGETHIYIGTSGWVVGNVDKRMTDLGALLTSILGAIPGHYNYIAEQETSGSCLQWVRDHLALDAIGIYLEPQKITDLEEEERSLYDYLNEVIAEVEPGSGGVIFTPWMHGNRAPFEDAYVRSMFFNVGLETGKRQMIRAVLEGDAYHKLWMLEAVEKRVPRQETLRFVGGGAQSDVWAQILADVTGRNIEVVADPQNAGALGAAITCAVGLGVTNFEQAKDMIAVEKYFAPNPENHTIYQKHYQVFKRLYHQNKKLYKELNG
jgi:xylulokinase